MRIDPVSGQVLGGPLEPVYVYEAPVRLWHWVMMVAMFVLAATGYLIGSPPPAIGGEATLQLLLRLHPDDPLHRRDGLRGRVPRCASTGRSSATTRARAIFIPPVWSGSWWKGLFEPDRATTCSCSKESDLWVGHNPLAQIAMFSMYTLGTIFIILTGLALYAEQWGWGTWPMNADAAGCSCCSAIRRWCARCITSRCGTCCCSRSSTCTWCSARTS